MRRRGALVLLLTILLSVSASADGPAYTTEQGVTLSPRMEGVLQRIGESYRGHTGREIHVTSGTRTPESQAEAMFDKLANGQSLLALYRDAEAAREVTQAFRANRRRGRDAAVRAMAAVIRAQVRRGCFISRHLSAGAADVRSRNMSRRERRLFERIVRQMPDVELLAEGSPPHFHLQLRDPR